MTELPPDDQLEIKWGRFRATASGRFSVALVTAAVVGVLLLGTFLPMWWWR